MNRQEVQLLSLENTKVKIIERALLSSCGYIIFLIAQKGSSILAYKIAKKKIDRIITLKDIIIGLCINNTQRILCALTASQISVYSLPKYSLIMNIKHSPKPSKSIFNYIAMHSHMIFYEKYTIDTCSLQVFSLFGQETITDQDKSSQNDLKFKVSSSIGLKLLNSDGQKSVQADSNCVLIALSNKVFNINYQQGVNNVISNKVLENDKPISAISKLKNIETNHLENSLFAIAAGRQVIIFSLNTNVIVKRIDLYSHPSDIILIKSSTPITIITVCGSGLLLETDIDTKKEIQTQDFQFSNSKAIFLNNANKWEIIMKNFCF